MTAMEEKEIALAEEKWVHEVEEELVDEEKIEEHFEECIHSQSSAM
jgi:hypothetical protein